MTNVPWHAPIKIIDLFRECSMGECFPIPHTGSVYLVTESLWVGQPTKGAIAWYVGINERAENAFVFRIGNMLIDGLGFFYEPDKVNRCRHSGG